VELVFDIEAGNKLKANNFRYGLSALSLPLFDYRAIKSRANKTITDSMNSEDKANNFFIDN
jgi:hypothetical protein